MWCSKQYCIIHVHVASRIGALQTLISMCVYDIQEQGACEPLDTILRVDLKAGSQSDARPSVVLVL